MSERGNFERGHETINSEAKLNPEFLNGSVEGLEAGKSILQALAREV